MRVALVHDWLVGQRGGEQVLLRLAKLFPKAPICTLVHAPNSTHPSLEAREIRTSWLQHAPGAPGRFRYLLPAMWHAVGQFDLRPYDLVLSTSHCVAVAAPTHAAQVHVAYVHSPMRYLYDQMDHYLPRLGRRLLAPICRALSRPLRWRDRRGAQGPNALLANSAFVAQRIARAWGRSATVVHPPVDVAYFAEGPGHQAAAPNRRRGFVAVNALVPYKRTDALVRWATATRQPLTVVGQGGEAKRLRAMAGPTVQFVPHLDRAALRTLLQGAEALLFAGEEDFGISPVEALAAGCPVVARAGGGVQESIVDQASGGTLGALFSTQDGRSPAAETAAIDAAVLSLRQRAQRGQVDAASCRAQARKFAPEVFDRAYLAALATALPAAHRAALPVGAGSA